MNKDFIVANHGKGKIDLSKFKSILQLRPTELHYKEDGSLTGEPSFAIVMTSPSDITTAIAGQISLAMLNEGLNELGYKIVSISK